MYTIPLVFQMYFSLVGVTLAGAVTGLFLAGIPLCDYRESGHKMDLVVGVAVGTLILFIVCYLDYEIH